MANEPQTSKTQKYTRFDVLQRIQHIVFLVSFTLLGFTGLPQKFPLSPISIGFFNLIGGIEVSRLIHHTSAIVMMIISLVHVLDVLYRVLVLRTPISMIPWINDLQHVIHDVQYYLGFKKHKAYYGRYSYAEKMEYLALIWGTIVMGLTGFMMWNPISTLRILPGEAVPAAKAAHGGEAVLAVLAIIIWHMYGVHVKRFNKSMFTGKMSEEDMLHEHPLELADIKAGIAERPVEPIALRKRQQIYLPIAAVITVVALGALYGFVNAEKTALTTTERQIPTIEVYVPQTATPAPTQTPTSLPTETPLPTQPGTGSTPAPVTSSLTWDNAVSAILQNQCSACHGPKAKGGLVLSTYADAMKGGTSGAIILPGDSTNSLIFIIQQPGDHYGQLTPEELAQVVEWINAGALEK